MAEIDQGLLNDLTHAINRHSAENGSDTPDYILGAYLYQCLMNFNEAMQTREKWYGRPIGIRSALTSAPDPTAPICERCGAKVHDPCPTNEAQAKCELPGFCFPPALLNIPQRLYDSEINFSITCFWDGGFDIELGDNINGYDAKTTVKTYAEAMAWLDTEARKRYPDSTYVTGKWPEGWRPDGEISARG